MASRDLQTIYVMWLRDVKGFFRSRIRLITTLIVPFSLLCFISFGFNAGFRLPGMPENINYLDFAAPGILGMTMLFGSIFAGMSVLWDREFGFLKEMIVAPVHRWAIVIGRIVGGVTTVFIQGLLILLIALLIGFKVLNPYGIAITFLFMFLIGVGFVGFGVALASIIEDTQAFSLLMQIIISPTIFLSGAFFPLSSLSWWIRLISMANPLVYGVDGLRYGLINSSQFPIYLNLSVLIAFDILMIILSSWFFSKNKG
ncbi:MAG: ABC transporter permease [Candidatus Paceibacterota bacterium]|jgi:ABC-2 type transport system permease protein|nr:ABC transporter permease [Candidatus Paceibacterota bacterium]